jgi:hypothetical protein
MASSSLLKTLLHKTIAEGLYKEVQSRTSKYYYFLGKTLSWTNEEAPPFPIDSFQYEKDVRNEIITVKQIKPSDVAFVVPRYDWTSGTVYDIYDDQYSTEVQGLNIINGGGAFTSIPTLTISEPDLPNGVQATATAVLYNSEIVGYEMTNRGSGYTNTPTVTITGGGLGEGAVIEGTITKAPSDAQKLEDAKFYVMTDDYNVYKCLDNNNGAESINKPIGTQILPITLADGYVWKYMYNVPIALRTKFLTDNQMPVITALSQQFYSAGGIEAVVIENTGSGYTNATITVNGDGYLESDPVFLTGINEVTGYVAGTNYADSDTVTIAPPVVSDAIWQASTTVYQGIKLSHLDNIYEVIQAGATSTVAPTHTVGLAANGTAALKFIGTTARAYPTFTSGGITKINLTGGVRRVNLISSGSGYTSNPTVTFSNATKLITSVNTTTETLTLGPHWYNTGDPVVYNNGGGTSIGNLVNNTMYYIIKASSTTVKLALSASDATAGTAINLSSSGSGAGHNLYMAHYQAQGVAEISPTGVVKRIIITDSGRGYPVAPTVTIGNIWSASKAVTLGQQYNVGGRLYTVTSAGTTGSVSGPTGTTIGTQYTDGTAGLTYVGTAASATSVLKYGSGYNTNPRITINTTTGSGFSASFNSIQSQAILLPIIENGQITSVQIDESGVGYSSAEISISGDGTGVVISPDISIGNINTLQANNELLTVSGTINNIQMISNGYAYGAAPIAITGDGTGATAEAVIEASKIVKINITNQGQGYTYANVRIGGNGKGAVARAIVSPYGGHGKDSYQELFARTLMFYSNVSRDKNQGFDVANDYRQIGILKNPRYYNTTNRFADPIGSGCFTISASYNTANFVRDMVLTVPRTVDTVLQQKRYIVIATNSTGTSLLVTSLDGDVPQVGDQMTNTNNQFVSVAAVGNPTVDKYSGDMLFIDNKAGFTPSADETVTLRTIITF